MSLLVLAGFPVVGVVIEPQARQVLAFLSKSDLESLVGLLDGFMDAMVEMSTSAGSFVLSAICISPISP